MAETTIDGMKVQYHEDTRTIWYMEDWTRAEDLRREGWVGFVYWGKGCHDCAYKVHPVAGELTGSVR